MTNEDYVTASLSDFVSFGSDDDGSYNEPPDDSTATAGPDGPDFRAHNGSRDLLPGFLLLGRPRMYEGTLKWEQWTPTDDALLITPKKKRRKSRPDRTGERNANQRRFESTIPSHIWSDTMQDLIARASNTLTPEQRRWKEKARCE
ncbi:hypothetical protein IAT40_002679 [Kwoniella sp. CBS 6097]